MPSPLQKVKRGDPLVIPAGTFNTMIDAARDFEQRQRSTQRTTQRDQLDAGIVLLRNQSGADRGRFDVLGISGPIIAPVANADEFKQRVALKGVLPAATHRGKFAILLEPAANQAIVRACLDGICAARVRMIDEAHAFADIDEGHSSRLASAASGAARMLWVEPIVERTDAAIAWTVIRLGGEAAGVEEARIEALLTGPLRLSCKILDADGVPLGLAFDVQVKTKNLPDPNVWANFDPPLAVGDKIDIAFARTSGKWVFPQLIVGTC
ncbi:MAG: hypothetical protein SF069_06500 [Phycisphaerae bacterium]|nr:hypothetical protein [Phycisphaerae bacterium]